MAILKIDLFIVLSLDLRLCTTDYLVVQNVHAIVLCNNADKLVCVMCSIGYMTILPESSTNVDEVAAKWTCHVVVKIALR